MALLIAVGGLLTLGTYGFIFGRKGAMSGKEWSRSFLPMATMALGGLMAAIAYKKGPASIVSPLSGAYPVVTLGFAWAILRSALRRCIGSPSRRSSRGLSSRPWARADRMSYAFADP